MSSKKNIYLAASAKLLDGNVTLANQLLAMLVIELTQLKQQLNKAFVVRNFGAVADIAHKIQGGACYCGITAITEVANKLEQASRKKHDEQILCELLNELNQQIMFVVKECEY